MFNMQHTQVAKGHLLTGLVIYVDHRRVLVTGMQLQEISLSVSSLVTSSYYSSFYPRGASNQVGHIEDGKSFALISLYFPLEANESSTLLLSNFFASVYPPETQEYAGTKSGEWRTSGIPE